MRLESLQPKYGLGLDLDSQPESDITTNTKNLLDFNLDPDRKILSFDGGQKNKVLDLPELIATGIAAAESGDSNTVNTVINSPDFKQAEEKAKQVPPPIVTQTIPIGKIKARRNNRFYEEDYTNIRRDRESEKLYSVGNYVFGTGKEEEDERQLLYNKNFRKPEPRQKEDTDLSETFGITNKEIDSVKPIFGQSKYGTSTLFDPFGRISIPKVSKVEDPFKEDKDKFERDKRQIDQAYRDAVNRGNRLGRFDTNYNDIPIMSSGIPGSNQKRLTIGDLNRLPKNKPNITYKYQEPRPKPHLNNDFPWKEITSDETLNKQLNKMGVKSFDRPAKPVESKSNVVGNFLEKMLQRGKDFFSRATKPEPVSESVAIALSTEDEQEAKSFIERMGLKELKEFYKHFTQEHPDIKVPEELKQELTKDDKNIDIELVRTGLIALKVQSLVKKDEDANAIGLQLTDEDINKMSDQELAYVYERIKYKYDLPYWLKFDYENDSTETLRAKLRIINKKYIQTKSKADGSDAQAIKDSKGLCSECGREHNAYVLL